MKIAPTIRYTHWGQTDDPMEDLSGINPKPSLDFASELALGSNPLVEKVDALQAE